MNAVTEEELDLAGAPGELPPLVLRREGGFRRFWRKLGGGSLMVATLLHVGLLLIATTVVLTTMREPEKKVDFIPVGKPGGGGGGGDMQKKAAQMAKSLPPASLKRVAAEGVTSALTLPDPGDSFGELSSLGSLAGGGGIGSGMGFGSGSGVGNGTGPGSGGTGIGAGGLGKGMVFFNQEANAGRVAYVIDYSGSMAGKRERLMRKELARSVENLSATMQFQLIFFCGPVWIAGDEFQTNEDSTVTITHEGRKYRWEKGKNPGSWQPAGKRPRASWLTADSATVAKAVSDIRNTRLQAGTHWVAPLEMALAMKPPPQVIFFMTDGASPGTTEDDIRRLGNRAKAYGVTINTMSMMEPAAEEGMKELARRSGGSFAIIEEDGKARDVPVD